MRLLIGARAEVELPPMYVGFIASRLDGPPMPGRLEVLTNRVLSRQFTTSGGREEEVCACEACAEDAQDSGA